MIIATIPESTLRIIKIPAEVKKKARGIEIYSEQSNGIFGSNCFFACREARPHNDSTKYSNMFFLTLVLISNHGFGDENAIQHEFSSHGYSDTDSFNSVLVPRGTLFIVDANCLHWLFPPLEEKTKIHPFICLQWSFDKNDPMLTDKIKAVVRRLNGEYVEIEGQLPRPLGRSL